MTQIDYLPHAPHHCVVASVGRVGQNVHIAPAPARVWMAQTIRPMCPTNARAHADAHAECTIAGIPETASALEQNLCDIPRQLAMAGDG